jgi:luciferase-like monooxygenase
MMSEVTIGVGLFPTEPVPRIVSLVRLAEELGFSCAYIGDSQMIWRECYVLLGAAATATKQIKLATGVTNPVTRELGVTVAAWVSLRELAGEMIRQSHRRVSSERSKEAEAALAGTRITPEVASRAASAALTTAKNLGQNAYKIPISSAAVERAILLAAGASQAA